MADYDVEARITANTRDYENGVKNAQKSTDDLTKKLDKLSKKIKSIFITGTIAKSISSVVTSFDDAKSQIVKGTGAIGDEFKSLNDSLNNSLRSGIGRSVSEVGSMIADLNTRFGVTGESLEKLTSDFDKFSRVTGTDTKTSINQVADVMNKWEIPLEHSKDILDQLTTASQMSGASVTTLLDGLKTGQSVFSQFGMGVTESISFLSALNKNGISTETSLTGMRTALTKFSNEGKNAQKEFQRISDKIKTAKSDSDALSIAIETFGTRAGTEMVRALRNAESSVEEFNDKLNNSRGSLERTAKESRTTRDAFNELKSTVLSLFGSISSETQGPLNGLIDKIKELLQLVEPDKIKEIFETSKTVIEDIYYAVAEVVGLIWDIVKQLFNLIHKVIGDSNIDFNDYVNALVSYLDNLFKMFQDVFNAIINILKGNFPLAWEYTKLAVLRAVDSILDNISLILNAFPELVNKIIDGLNVIIKGVNKARSWMGKDPFDEIEPFSNVNLSGLTGVEEQVQKTEKKIEEMTGKASEKSIKDLNKVSNARKDLIVETEESEIKISDVVIREREKQKNVIVEIMKDISDKTRHVFNEISAWLKKYHIPQISKTLVTGVKKTFNVISSILSASYKTIKKLLSINLDDFTDIILEFEDSILTFFLITMPKLPGYLKEVMSGFSSILKDVQNSMDVEQFQQWFYDIFSSISDSIPSIIESITNITLTFLQSFINALSLWVSNGGFETLVSSVFDGFKSILNFVLDNLPQLLEMAIRIVTDIVTEIINILPDVIQKIITTIVNLIPSLITSIIDSIAELLPAIIEFIPKIIKVIAEAIPDVVTAILNMIPDIIDSIVNVIVQIIPAIVDIIPQLIKILVETIPNIVTAIVDALPGIIVSIVDAVAEIIPAIIGIIPDLIVALINALPDIVTAIVLALPQIIASVISAILQLIPTIISFVPEIAVEIVNSFISFFTNFSWSSFADFGKAMIDGIAKGFGNIWNTLKSAWQAFVDGFKKFFGIHSPSTMFEEFGGFMVEGLLNAFKGLGKLFSNIWEGLKDIVSGFVDWFKNIFSGLGNWFSNIWGGITSGLKTAGSKIADWASDVWEGTKNVASKVGGFFSDVWEGTKKIGSKLGSKLSDVGSSIWEGTKNVASKVGGFFKKLKFWETGVNNAPRGLALVGEAGPELVDFRGGERVYNSQNTRDILKGNSTGNTFNVSFYNTQDTSAFEMIKQLKQYNRNMAINGVL